MGARCDAVAKIVDESPKRTGLQMTLHILPQPPPGGGFREIDDSNNAM